MNLNNLTDSKLLDSANTLVGNERNVVADLLLHLIEIEVRDLHLSLGHSSMFDYQTKGLQFSEPAAARRLRAARCLRDNPKAEAMLRSGELNLTTLCQASSVVKNESVSIEKFSGVSSRKAELLAAEYKSAPTKKLKDTIKPIGRRKAESNELPVVNSTVGADSSENSALTPVKHKVSFEAGEEFVGKLDEVRAVLSNKLGAGASLEEVLGACMEVCLEKCCPKRKALRRGQGKAKQVKKEVKNFSQRQRKSSRHIPAKTRAEVMRRDGYRCSYKSADSRRCGCKSNLEIDHVMPFAAGGKSEPENLRVLCRAHNQFEARQAFGDGVIRASIERRKAA